MPPIPTYYTRMVLIAALAPTMNACAGAGSSLELERRTSFAVMGQDRPKPVTKVKAHQLTKWAPPEGIELLHTNLVKQFTLHIQKPSASAAEFNQISAPTDNKKTLRLRYDFGCNTPIITPKKQDCRNVVAATSEFNQLVNTTNDDTIYFEARNTDLHADFAIRVRDKSGQTIQYPLTIRSIEANDPNEWALARVPLKVPTLFWGGANDGIIKGGILALSVIAFPRNNDSATAGLNYPIGEIELRNARLVRNHVPEYVLSKTPSTAPGPFYPTTEGRLIVAHNNFNRAALEKAKEAGFSGIRRDIYWEHVEKKGAYRFDAFREGAKNLDLTGLKVLWILDYGHPEHGGKTPKTTSDIDAFAKFASAAANAWKDHPVLGYEIWNEPDTEMFWPNVDVDRYAELLKRATAALKAEHPSVKILSGGVGLADPAYLFKLAKTGALNNVDAIGVHPYRYDTQTHNIPRYRRIENSPESYAGDKLVAQKYLSAAGVLKPLANTEWGYSSTVFLDENIYGNAHSTTALERHAILTLRMVLTQLATNEPLITVFRLADKASDPKDKEMNFGLLDSELQEKPAYKAIKALRAMTSTKTFQGYLANTPPGVTALKWINATGNIIVCIWNHSSGRITVNIDTHYTTVMDRYGKPIKRDPANPNFITLREEDGPLYFIKQ